MWDETAWLDNTGRHLIEQFWQAYGEEASFPRNLEQALALALPVILVKFPRLKLREAERWLQSRGKAFSFNCKSRAVRGCLVAFGGDGYIFVDGTDPVDEQRFSIAHETAHFMVDYWYPRQQALEKFGPAILEVLDGRRVPTFEERLSAIFGQVPIGVHSNLMERENEGQMNSAVWSIEDRADRLALTLLAPPEAVLNGLNLAATAYTERQDMLKKRLQHVFGLPGPVAGTYSRFLLKAAGLEPSWVETLRIR